MSVNLAEQQVLLAILVGFTAIIPAAVGFIIAYIKAKEALLIASDKTTHDEVKTLIDKKVEELQQTNDTTT